MGVTTTISTRTLIRDYYGRLLQGAAALKTDACCSGDRMPLHLREVVQHLAPEVVKRSYGCGSPIPLAIEGCTVLDLGCGTGRDAFICSKLVGPRGQVIGLDMTTEQLRVAQDHETRHARAFGYSEPNTRFVQGYMEDLAEAGIEDESVDVVISNCVINLALDKAAVFSEIFRVLKPGGELYFSDIFADRRLPNVWRHDQVLLGECLAGAMYVQDFRRMLMSMGIADFRIVTRRAITIRNEAVEARVGTARFESLTIRVFKLSSLEDRCEDYGQVVTYAGTVPHCTHSFVLDDDHEFITAKPMLVCGNTAAMLADTRLGRHFDVQEDRSRHFGLFPCGSGSSGLATAPAANCC